MNIVDKIIFFSALFFFWRGWGKGFLQTVLGPIALIIGTAVSFLYYFIFHNLIISTAIGIVLPIILSIIFSMTIGVIFLGQDKKYISTLSRFCGGAINALWGEFLFFMTMFLIILIPLRFPLIESAQRDIKESSTYTYLNSFIKEKTNVDIANNLDPSQFKVLTDPKELDKLSQTPEFQNLLEDPLVQNLLNDPDANKAIESKDLGKLIQNPHFIAITKDPALLKKFLSLYSTILNTNKTEKSTHPSTEAKTKKQAPVGIAK
ncbi:MAG: CvpA family protein [Candidatus Omnitrophica bacterium]|nr:CvpA family protein [Candidatus Omnitrophota bacterium]